MAGYSHIEVYTTRPDTLMGVSYVSLAPQHPVALELAEKNPALQAFLQRCNAQKTSEAELASMEKLGIDTGLSVEHPLSGDRLPLWVANYVLMDYGSGAVMAVPAHDQRDYEFADKYQLPKLPVVDVIADGQASTDKGLLINSGEYNLSLIHI